MGFAFVIPLGWEKTRGLGCYAWDYEEFLYRDIPACDIPVGL